MLPPSVPTTSEAGAHGRGRRIRRITRIILVTVLACLAGVGMIRGSCWVHRKLITRWLKTGSGKSLTPGEAAKKVIEKIKE